MPTIWKEDLPYKKICLILIPFDKKFKQEVNKKFKKKLRLHSFNSCAHRNIR